MGKPRTKLQRHRLVWVLLILLIAGGLGVFQLWQSHQQALPYSDVIASVSREAGLDPCLVAAVVYAESRFDPEAVSHRDARGLMQIIPDTAYFVMAKTGHEFPLAELMQPERNIRTGCWYLKYLLDLFGDVDVAVAAYNAGPGNAKAWLADPAYSADGQTLHTIPFKETAAYVKIVRRVSKDYRERVHTVFP